VNVDGAWAGEGVAPDGAKQLSAGEDLSGVLGEIPQEVELPPAQWYLGAVPVDGTRAAVEPYRVGVGGAIGTGGGGRCRPDRP
jgi:hypothetical protein